MKCCPYRWGPTLDGFKSCELFRAVGDCHVYMHGSHVGWENANIGDYTPIYTSENIISFLKYGSKSCRGVSTMKDDESFLFKCVHQKMKTYTRLPCGFLVDFSNKKWESLESDLPKGAKWFLKGAN